MVVGEDNACCPISDGIGKHFAGMNVGRVDQADRYGADCKHLICAVQRNTDQVLLLECADMPDEGSTSVGQETLKLRVWIRRQLNSKAAATIAALAGPTPAILSSFFTSGWISFRSRTFRIRAARQNTSHDRVPAPTRTAINSRSDGATDPRAINLARGCSLTGMCAIL